jgi:hypothetical protein
MSRVEQTHEQLDGGHHRGGRSAAPVLEVMGVRDERADRFVELSAYLTGYGRVELNGTGLTIAALCFKSAAHMIKQLRAERAPVALSGSAPGSAQ